MKLTYSLALALWLFGSAVLHAMPPWLKAAASTPNSNLQGGSAVVLLDETSVDVDGRGVATIVHRKAIRLRDNRGSAWAWASVYYNEVTDRVKTTNAWVVRGAEETKASKRSDWVDFTEASVLSLCGDIRQKRLYFGDFVTRDDVFGFETVVEGPLFEAQLSFHFDNTLPTLSQAYRVTVPVGFKLEHVMHGIIDVAGPTLSDQGRTLTWEVRDQPLWSSEPYSPDFMRIAPAIGVKIVPPQSGPFTPAVFKKWGDVGAWQEKLQSGQCDVNQALKEKAVQLTADCPDPLSKIRALSVFVQQLRYVASDKDLGKGDGYKPRKATVVLQRAYGDCKDKSNLLRAMLREVGITTYLACARATDDLEVWADFPSLGQFNHAICAIKVGPEVDLPAIVQVNGERLLFFDPTDSQTIVGDLPDPLQGSPVGLMTPDGEGLVTLPNLAGPNGHAYRRQITLRLSLDGTAEGSVKITGGGQAGSAIRRALFVADAPRDLEHFAANQLSDVLRSAHLTKEEKNDDRKTGLCALTFNISVADYLQRMPGALAVARLDLLSRAQMPNLPGKDRKYPVVLRPMLLEDEIEVELPPGMTIDELPAKASKKTAFGSYDRECELRGNTVIMRRRAELTGGTVAVSEYPALRQFLVDTAKSERATLLLKMAAGPAVTSN